MTLKKVTDHFGASVTRSENRVTGDRWVTDRENDPSPRKPLFFNSFLAKGDRVTDKIEIIGYIYNKVKKGKIGHIAPQNRNIRQTRNHLSPVTRPLDGPLWGASA